MKTKISLLAWLTLVTFLPALGHTSYPETVKCPIDGKEFTIYVTGSYTTFKTLKDFQKQGAIGDLYESYVNACPKCHYAGYQSDFKIKFNDNEKKDILVILESYKDVKLNDAIENEIAIKIHQYLKKGNDDIANLYLVASYFLRDEPKQTEKRKELQRNCISFLLLADEAGEYKPDTRATIQYLIGELYRRTGDFDKAVKYFDLAINDTNKKDWVLAVAEEQRKLALEKNDDNSI